MRGTCYIANFIPSTSNVSLNLTQPTIRGAFVTGKLSYKLVIKRKDLFLIEKSLGKINSVEKWFTNQRGNASRDNFAVAGTIQKTMAQFYSRCKLAIFLNTLSVQILHWPSKILLFYSFSFGNLWLLDVLLLFNYLIWKIFTLSALSFAYYYVKDTCYEGSLNKVKS